MAGFMVVCLFSQHPLPYNSAVWSLYTARRAPTLPGCPTNAISPQDEGRWLDKSTPPSPDHTSYWNSLPNGPEPVHVQTSTNLLLGSNLPSTDHTPWAGVMAKGLLCESRMDRAWMHRPVSTHVHGGPSMM